MVMDELQIITADFKANGQSAPCAICFCFPFPNKNIMQYRCFCYAEIDETSCPLYEHLYTDDDNYTRVACNKGAKESFLTLYKSSCNKKELDEKLVDCFPDNDSDITERIRAILRNENGNEEYHQQIAEVLKTELHKYKSEIH